MNSASRRTTASLTWVGLVITSVLFISGFIAAPASRVRTRGMSGGTGEYRIATAMLASDSVAPVGVQLYSFRDAFKTDVRGTLKHIHELGFRDVELAGTYGLSAAKFRQLLDSAGLHASSMHVGYEQFRDSLPHVLADAKTLGVRYLGTAWIPHPDGPISVAVAREAATNFNKWGRAARGKGFQFFYHVHGYEFVPGDKGVRPLD